MRAFLAFLLLLTTSHSVCAWMLFDGSEKSIPGSQWQILDGEMPPVEALADNPDRYPWVPLEGNTQLGAIGERLMRLDLRVTYSGIQRPLLLIPYAFVPNLKVGVIHQHRLLMWESLQQMDMSGKSGNQSFGMIVLPIDKPGDYQILVKGSQVANAVIIRGAQLHLDHNFILRDYPASVSTASAILGALSTFLIFCTAVLFYRFRVEYAFALIFLAGSFISILLREGILFLSWDLEASWWVSHFLPLGIGMCNAGAMFYVCSDIDADRWRIPWRLVKWSGVVALSIGFLNIFLPTRDNQFYSVPGFAFVMLGTVVALLMVLARAWKGSLRERLFALFIAPYFAVSLARFTAATMQATVNIPVIPMYASFYLFGTFVFVEYLVTLTREYVDERARRTADKARVDLVNRFSHELRTPLNAVIGLADLMKNSPGSPGQGNVENYANMIQSAGNTLLGLVDDILDFSKLEETGIPLADKPLRLDKLMSEVMSGFVPQAMQTRIIPKVLIEPEVPYFLVGDEVRIKQIFLNLVNNAIKFSPPNEFVTVRVKRGVQQGDRVELLCSVGDRGRGIPPEKMDIIFEPYAQVDAEDGGRMRGTGLGLAICKRLIEQMDGHISVHSITGEGTEFSFNLWLRVNADAPDLNVTFGPLRGTRFLLVSALKSVTDYLPLVLQHWGVDVEVVATGSDASASHYDVVLVESMYREAVGEAEWINRLDPSTVVEIIEIRAGEWVTELTHTNVHRLVVPIPLLAMLGKFTEHFSGASVDLGDEVIDSLELHHFQHNVLLIDDNVVNLTVASKLLESLGVRCETASSGRLGLEKLTANSAAYTLVLLDCEMPDINGFEVCRQWRRAEQEQGLLRLPVVALTAHALIEVREECLAVGMDEVVYKPIGREAIIELLNRYPDKAD